MSKVEHPFGESPHEPSDERSIRPVDVAEDGQRRAGAQQCGSTPEDEDGSSSHGRSVNQADLTVITPTILGREDALEECKRSVQAQTVPVTQHRVGLDELRVGPGHVRNHLLGDVETEWCLFLDDDDVLYSDYVATVAPHFHDSDVVYTWCDKNFDYNTDIPFDGPALYERNVIPVTACVRVDAIRGVGGFPTDVAYEDWALWLKLLDNGARFTCIEERKWSYRRADDGRDAENNERLARGEIKPL